MENGVCVQGLQGLQSHNLSWHVLHRPGWIFIPSSTARQSSPRSTSCECFIRFLWWRMMMFQRLWWLRPLGYLNTPSWSFMAQTLQQFMDRVVRGLDFIVVYIDTIVVASSSLHQHADDIQQVLACLQDHRLGFHIAPYSLSSQSGQYTPYLRKKQTPCSTPALTYHPTRYHQAWAQVHVFILLIECTISCTCNCILVWKFHSTCTHTRRSSTRQPSMTTTIKKKS